MLVSPEVGALQTNGFRIGALLLRLREVPRTHIYKISGSQRGALAAPFEIRQLL